MQNPYQQGTWESRNWALMMSGHAVKQQKIALTIAKHELEPDEFFTAAEKAIQIDKQNYLI